MIEERTKGAWADIVTADEAEPIEALLVGQPDALAHYAHVTSLKIRSSIADGVRGLNPKSKLRDVVVVLETTNK